MKQIDFSSVDLNLLKVFEALYEEGTASQSAVRLGVTQSAVSASLGRLRLLYGDHLFVRTGRGMKPTSRAHELQPHISQALDKCRQSIALATPSLNQIARTIALGLSDDYEVAIGSTFIEVLHAKFPNVQIIFRQTNSLVVNQMLLDREIDLSLTAGGLSSSSLGRHAVGSGTYSCLLSPSVESSSLDIESYLELDHILISSGGFVGVVDEALSAQGKKRRVKASTTHFAALPFLLTSGNVVATLPTHAALAISGLAGLKCIACPLALPRYAIEIGWRKDSTKDVALNHVRSQLIQVCERTWSKFVVHE